MSEAVIFSINDSLDGLRIDKAVSEYREDISRSFIQKLIEQGEVRVNGETVGKSYKVSKGDIISVSDMEIREISAEPQNIPLDVRYEDNCLLVVNKPKGMVVHPAPGNYDGTLVNALLYYCKGSLSGINGVLRPGIVHRIDKNTSGLLIVAKNDISHLMLSEQISTHSFKREYRAVVYGHLKETTGTVSAPIGRDANNRMRMCVTDRNSKNAVTHYEVLEEFDGFSYIKLNLETGRTHQIRVHMKYIGHPVAGDDVYGPKNVIKKLNGQCLHAGMIGFNHPVSGEYIEVRSELPDYFDSFLEELRNKQRR